MKKKLRSMEEIKKDMLDLSLMRCKPSFSRPKPGEVIDEEKSVKWNREEVERLTVAYEEEVKRLNTLKNKRRDELKKELYAIIQKEVGNITLKDAEAIYEYAEEARKRYRCSIEIDIFTCLPKVMSLISGIVNHENDKKEVE